MGAGALGAFLERSSAEYVRERIEAGDSPEYAAERAAQSNAEYFPDGKPAEGQLIFDVVDDSQGEGGEVVGTIWIGPFSLEHPTAWWVFDVEIVADKRGQGYGRLAMQLAEVAAREHGAEKLGLNVFGHNSVAQNLYRSLGYETTAINMAKSL
ncbi:GNAT family N-acetyltransferase [Herbiconiux sp.]|uniref:GNAT family N-acetyltransferase n=1 Tax=Herbiconiux sp. TaxID=1871186 RepID=UPI0025BDE69B|nr:GNAT family N-acetyltransferase [Herbiconiux sp.]